MLGAALACAALAAPAAASAAEQQTLQEYQYVVDREDAALLAQQGIELDHTGFDAERKGVQRIVTALYPFQADALARQGLEASRVVVQEAQAKPETGGDSPSPYYDVFRSYSEPGGVADEMRALAADHRDVLKLVQIGTSRLGKPIYALKMTANARNVADGTRAVVLYSAVNHAREWIAAEVGRRLPRWFAEHKDDPQIANMLGKAELWFLPVQNPDGYDYTFTCGRGDSNRLCGHGGSDVSGNQLNTTQYPSNRLWRKTLRDNNGNGIYGDAAPVTPGGPNVGDGVDPNRNYPTAWNLDEEGASNNPSSEVYRGPQPLSEPENLAYDRLLRKLRPAGLINYHSAAQLLLYPFGYITDVYADDNPWFVALTGTDGDAAVDPYTPQRSSDLYVTNGETTDHAYNKYATMAWTPELDTCTTAAGGPWCTTTNPSTNNSGFYFPDDESKVRAVFEKNLDFARNVAVTLASDQPDRPRNATENESTYQVKGVPDIELNQFGVSFGSVQTIEANVRKALGSVDVQLSVASGPGGNARSIVLPMTPWRGGERYGDLRGRFYHRMRVTPPADFRQPGAANPGAARPLVAGDTVTATIRAGGQQQVFRYRVQATQQDANKRRVLVVAAEDYTGASPNKAPYATAPRYLAAHRQALEAAGYEVETYDVDAPPAGPAGTTPPKILSSLGVLSHFDAVLYYTGDDLVPQDLTEPEQRRASTAAASGTFNLTGSTHLAQWGVRNAQHLRDYINEGGKVVLAGRNAQVPLTSTGTGLQNYSGYGWWQDQQYGFNYPPNQAGNDDRPHTAYFRELDVSNDFGQWFLGVASRQAGYGTTIVNGQAVNASTGGIFAGMSPITIDTAAGNDPNESATGAADPRPKAPTRLRALSSVTAQRAFRQERVELDYANGNGPAPPNPAPAGTRTQDFTNGAGGAAISTRDSITFGFGLEQVAAAARNELVARAFGYLLPTTADSTAPTVTWWRPDEGAQVSPADPVEIEVEAVDERGDMKEVRLKVGDQLIQTKVSFPFQLRWQPTMADVGSTRTLTVEAEDAAGNVSTTTRTVRVVAAAASVESPLPAVRARIDGVPVVGQTLRCVGEFVNTPTSYRYAWFRNGSLIVGQEGERYVPVSADVGTQVTCQVTAVNAAGDADSTSDGRTIQLAPTGAAGGDSDGARGPQGPAGRDGSNTTRPRARVASRMTTPTVTPRRDTRVPIRIRTSGRVRYPSGVSRVEACRGIVAITIKAGARTISRRATRVSSSCTYRSSVTFRAPSRFGRARALRVITRFQGNAVLGASQAREVQVRIR